jgi:hypothetical protein
MRLIGTAKTVLCIAALVASAEPAAAQVLTPSRIGGSLATRGNGTIVLATRGSNSALNLAERTSFSGAGWSQWDAWYDLGTSIASAPAVVLNWNSKLFAVARGNDGRLYYRQETSAGSKAFAPWARVPINNASGQPIATFTARPAVARRTDGLLSLYATDSSGKVWEATQQTSGGSWGPWRPLDSPSGITLRQSPVVAVMSNGSFLLFASASNNKLYARMQASGTWGAWTDLGGTVANTEAIASGANSNGRISVFTSTTSGAVAVRTQTSANTNTWTAWATLPGSVNGQSRPAVANHADGRLAIFLRGSNNTVSWQSQTSPSSTSWTSWSSFYSGATSPPAVITDQNGILHFAVLGSGGYVYERTQSSANSTSFSQVATGYLGGPFASL